MADRHFVPGNPGRAARPWHVALAVAVAASAIVGTGFVASTGQHVESTTDALISVDPTAAVGTIGTRLGTQFVWPGDLDRASGTRERFVALSPAVVRINVTTDGIPGLPLAMPAGVARGDWNFGNLDSMLNDAQLAGADVLLTVSYAPQWMWECPRAGIRDPTFAEYGDYLARVVAYYNVGSFSAENGRTVTNPSGAGHRIRYWELWNEPDQRTQGCPPAGSANLSVDEYVRMWNAVVPKMLAQDPTIKIVGPATGNAITGKAPDYLPALMARAMRKPDIVSFHAYGGWLNSQSDRFLFEGQRNAFGLDAIAQGLETVQTWAPGIPVWLTELNANSAASEDDPAQRPWNAFGAAWGASAFRRLALGGADAIYQYQFAHPGRLQFSLIDTNTGTPLLPYWRDYYLARYFPPGSVIVASTSSRSGVEVLAARQAGSSNVRVLVVNREIDDGAVGGAGVSLVAQVVLSSSQRVTSVTSRMLDRDTPLEVGPPAVDLPGGNRVRVTFSGFGVALLDFTGEPALAPGLEVART